MVLPRKADGTPRRTVDLSPLNAHCNPSYQTTISASIILGFHSVPIHPKDEHYTAFITPWGRYRYKVAPQGFLASGNGYARKFDEIIADIERKSKYMDDTIMWDDDLEKHWWRMIDYLTLLGQSGVKLNQEKFQFCQKVVNFAGFRITASEIKPFDKFILAIKEFPTPRRITDVRS